MLSRRALGISTCGQEGRAAGWAKGQDGCRAVPKASAYAGAALEFNVPSGASCTGPRRWAFIRPPHWVGGPWRGRTAEEAALCS